MHQITIPSTLGLGLENITGPVTLFDEHGQVLGQFVPAAGQPLVKPEDNSPYTEEQLRASLAEALANPQSGKPLSQIWRELENTP